MDGADGMRAKDIPLIMITLLILTAGMSFLLVNEADAQEDPEIKLYLHTGLTLDTILPTSTDSAPTVISPVEEGTEVVYGTLYPITEELHISGIQEGGNRIMTLHLPNSITTGITPEHTLDVRVVIIPGSGSEIQVAGAIFSGEDMETDDLFLDLTSNSGSVAPAGSTIELRLTLTGTPGTFPPSTFSLSYWLPGSTDHSYLSFMASPIDEDGIDVSLTDMNGFPLEEILPNGPANSRTFNIIVSVIDAFGAYDVSEIGMIISSDIGNIIWNFTGEPDENGGEKYAYLNETHTLPEGTPEGTYDIIISVTSHTGMEVTSTHEMVIASGLQISVDDPDRDADAGDTLEFTVDILNGGEGTDRVTFSFGSDLGWNVDVPDPIEIEGGMTGTVVFRVFVPLRSSAGDEEIIELNAGSNNAGKTYSKDITIFVETAAVFGVEPVGETTRSVVAGAGVQFSIRVVNIQDDPGTFEMGIEDLPNGWSASYSGENGTLQGSIFVMDIPAEGESVINVNMMTDPSSGGVHDPSIFVRERGSTQRKYVYLKVRIVDPSRPALTLLETTDTKSSGRVGSNLPIRYSEVFFNLELYNPTLSDAHIRINVFGPTEWTLEYDYNILDLLPGELSKWNISITPRDGELYQEEAFPVDIEISGGDIGTHSQKLKVELKKITLVEASPDRDSPDVVQGDEIPINVTLRNNGNHPVDLTITVDVPQGFQIAFEPQTVSIEADDDVIIRLKVTAVKVEEEGKVTFSIKYSGDDVDGSKDLSVYAIKEKTSDDPIDPMIIIGILIALVVIGAGFFVYMKFFKGSERETGPTVSRRKSDPFEGVKVEAAPSPRESRARPIRPPTSSGVIQEADDIAASILASDTNKKELSGGVTIEAEPQVVTAEIVE